MFGLSRLTSCEDQARLASDAVFGNTHDSHANMDKQAKQTDSDSIFSCSFDGDMKAADNGYTLVSSKVV